MVSFNPGKENSTLCTGGCVDFGSGLEACGKSSFHQVSNPEHSKPQRLVVTITLSQPHYIPNT